MAKNLGKAILFGTIYTAAGFALSFLFLHFAAYMFLDQTGLEFINTIDQGRITVQQSYSNLGSNNWVAWLLADKVYFSIIAGLVLLIWLSNILRQLNKQKEE